MKKLMRNLSMTAAMVLTAHGAFAVDVVLKSGAYDWLAAGTWLDASTGAAAAAPTGVGDRISLNVADNAEWCRTLYYGTKTKGGKMPDYAIGTLSGSYQQIHFGGYVDANDYQFLMDTPANVSQLTIVNPNDFHGWLKTGGSYYRFSFPCTAGTPKLAHLSPESNLELQVADGGRAVVADLFTRGNVTKTGGGVLEIDSTRTGRNRIFVKQGTLAFGATSASLDSILAKASLQLDASRRDSMKLGTDADGRVTVVRWNDARQNGEYARPIERTDHGSSSETYVQHPRAPYLSEAKSATGLPLVDFGATPSDDPSFGPTGCCMRLSRRFAAKEVVYVISRPDDANTSYAMGDTEDYSFHPGGDALFNETLSFSGISEKYCFFNGLPFVLKGNYQTAGRKFLHTIDVALGGAVNVSLLASDRYIAASTGGMRMAEVLLFEERLTDEERTILENYLHRKWYENADRRDFNRAVTVDAVELASGTSIDVAEGVTARVNYVITDASTGVVKTGSGVLEVGKIVDRNGKALSVKPDVRGGSFVNEAALSVGDTAPEDACMWLDSSVGVEQSSGVAKWNDRRNNGRYAYTPDSLVAKPALVENALAGRPAVSFGIARSATGTYMQFNEGGEKTYAAFMVIRPNQTDTAYGYNDRPVLFGDAGFQLYRFRGSKILATYYFNCFAEAAGWNVNAVAVNPHTDLTCLNQTSEFFLIGFSGDAALRIDRLFSERDNATNSGGFQVCEFISYDRKLTADEVASVEAYLMNRWFAKRHPFAEHGVTDYPPESPVTLDSATVSTYDRIYGGNGNLVKTGSGEVRMTGSLDDFTSLSVSGILRFRDSLPDAGAVFHFDAADTAAMDLDGAKVLTWKDVRRAGPLATSLWTVQGETCPGASYAHAHPLLSETTINGVTRPGVSLGTMQAADAAGFMLSENFQARETFTVFDEPVYNGAESGRGMIVGCGSDLAFWNRAYNREILGGDLVGGKKTPARIVIDGTSYDKHSRAPNGIHLFSIAMEQLCDVPYIGSDRQSSGTGGGMMFEQVVFGAEMSAAERATVENYLTSKWFGTANGVNDASDKTFTFNVDADGTLGLLDYDGFLDCSKGISFAFTAEKGAPLGVGKFPFMTVSEARGVDPDKVSFDVSGLRVNALHGANRAYAVTYENGTFCLTVEKLGMSVILR